MIIDLFFKLNIWKIHGPGNSEEGGALEELALRRSICFCMCRRKIFEYIALFRRFLVMLYIIIHFDAINRVNMHFFF